MRRRSFLPLLLFALPLGAAEIAAKPEAVRGKLIQGDRPELELPGGKHVVISGDEPTLTVLRDCRVAGFDIELDGHYTAPDAFEVDPIHTRSIFAWKGGRKYMVTYWCDVCSIRSYTPGKCWCCQGETRLDLVDPKSI